MAEKKSNNSGRVVFKYQIFEAESRSNSNPIFYNNFRIWYKDNFVIEEVGRINLHEDTFGIKSRQDIVLGYIFIDLDNGNYFCYKNFSDTSKMIKYGNSLDSIHLDLGWNFYNNKYTNDLVKVGEMADTLINGSEYQRFNFSRRIKDNDYSSIGYYLCSANTAIFNFDNKHLKGKSCPLVRLDNIPVNRKLNSEVMELEFLSNHLSHYEKMVFKIWTKKTIEYKK